MQAMLDKQLKPLIEEYMQGFAGSDDYRSGVSDGMYQLGKDLLEQLHSDLVPVVYSNGYGITAVPKSALLGATCMVKIKVRNK